MFRAPRLLALLLAMLIPAASAQAADPTTHLEVGYMPILPVAQLFVMEGEGWTSDAGLELSLTRFSSGPAMVQALASGELDVMYFGIGPAMVARANGVPIKVLAASIREQIGLVARGELADSFARVEDPAEAIARFTEAQGRKPKIATFPRGSVPDTVLRHWLVKQLGIGEEAVEIIAMGADRVQQADEDNQRGVLEQTDEGVHDSGYGNLECLRQDDQAHGLGIVQPQRVGGLVLPLG